VVKHSTTPFCIFGLMTSQTPWSKRLSHG